MDNPLNPAGSDVQGLSRVRVYLFKVSLKLKDIMKKRYPIDELI
jgi:hypothetical protein